MKNLQIKRKGVWVFILLSSIAGFAAASPGKEPAKYQDTAVGFTRQGHPFRGDPEAPVTIEEYSDYLCPFCARHFDQTLPVLVEKYIKTGKLKYVFRDYPIAKLHPSAAKGHSAALCAAEQSAVLFWKMHNLLFQQQQQWNKLDDPTDFLTRRAKELGADMESFNTCMASDRKAGGIEKSIADGQALEFNGTPTFRFSRSGSEESYTLVGAQGIKAFTVWMDSLLAGGEPPLPKPPELPFWAKPEGLAPDTDRAGYNTAGDAYKGSGQARLVVVEFSDFQCPSCRRQALETFPELDKQFIETGKVMWVFKHLPLKMHPHAPAAATAAECAGDQNEFWAMHHLLYEKQEEWSKENSDAELVKLAQQLGMDMPAFEKCFNSRTGLERVLHDIYDAQGIIQKTPSFILISNGKASKMQGTKSPENFAKMIEKRLEKK